MHRYIKGAAILYHGPSMIDGEEIIVVATSNSRNSKTGAMIQTWIIRADVAPHTARKLGADVSICGECPRRDGTCYVRLDQAPLSVYRSFHRGRYARATTADARRAMGAGRIVRIGSYGDPAAVPAYVWAQLLADSAGRTGYTHQWAHADTVTRANAAALRPYVMASADSRAEHDAATADGWRTFRARLASEPAAPRERVCPASAEAGYKTTCDACRACSGAAGRGHSSIVINLHGAMARRLAA